ncbi:MAG: hypothetical protein ACMUIE_08075 [Thermoplasmatota archaeon]
MVKLDLAEFNMMHWIRDDVPIPVRTILNLTSENDIKNPYSIDHQQLLTYYLPGSDIIVYGSVDYIHDEHTTIEEIYPVLSDQFHVNWDMTPRTGSMGGTFNPDNDPEERLDLVKSNPSYMIWEKDKDGLFAVYTNFSRYSSISQWKFSISGEGDEWAWNSTVVANNSQGLPMRIEPVDISREEIGEILTYSGAEFALKGLISDLDEDLSTKLYGRAVPNSKDAVRSDKHSIGVRADHDLPLAGIIDPTISKPIEMCLVVESLDGSMKIGIDMTNGQLAYVHRRTVSR